MWDNIIAVLLVAVVFLFVLAWGYVKQQRRSQELISELKRKVQEKVLKEMKVKGSLSKKEIEDIITGTKASLFWSRKKVQVTDAKILSATLIQEMVFNSLVRETMEKGTRRYEIY